jgi:DNA-binding response OmpR family regulator
MPSALYIEDDARLAALIRDYLAKHDVEVTVAGDGEAGLKAFERGRFDLVLLDLMLPGLDGLEVCRRIRAHEAKGRTPVLMLTAKGEDIDKIVGLELGADDYLAKPFNPRELLARIRAVLRRATAGPAESAPRFQSGQLAIDFAAREVTVSGKRVVLTHFEFELLALLARSAGRVLSRDQIVDRLKGEEWGSYDRSIDVHVSKLRSKIEDDPKQPRWIKTVRGVGYVLSRPDAGGG